MIQFSSHGILSPHSNRATCMGIFFMKLVRWTFLLMLSSAAAVAEDIKVVGGVDLSIQPPSKSFSLRATSKFDTVRHITLLKVELSDKARQKFERRANDAVLKANNTVLASTSAKKVQLGMGNVPVLDQGAYGSCVMFAATAAVDAVINKGDYISQLCLLQLGRYLENNAYNPSGWNGSLGSVVLNQMSVFGLVSKAKQTANGCGGLTEYPPRNAGGDILPGTEMMPVDYHALSEPMDDDVVAWSPVLDIYQVILDNHNPNTTLSQVKAVLSAGDRLIFVVLLPAVDKGLAGAVGKYHAANDSWLLTPEIVDDLNFADEFPAAHEMVITGYDDDAVAVDDHGRSHKGLFTLRNSWGANIGDKGNFYMSYDYFKTLAMEVQRIRNLND